MPLQFSPDGLGPDLEKGQVQQDHEESVQIGGKPAGRFGPEQTGGHAEKDHQEEDDIFGVQHRILSWLKISEKRLNSD